MHNHVILTGRITADPELAQTSSNVLVCRFSLAVQRKYNKKNPEQEPDFFEIEAWRGNAEFISKYFHKGDLMDISGRLKTSRWKDNDDKNHYKTSVVVEDVEFAPTNNRKVEEKAEKNEQSEDTDDMSEFVEVIEKDQLPF